MKSQPELDERLREAADLLEIAPPPIERIVRHGRRRFALKMVSSVAVAVVVTVALVWTGLSLSGFREELRLGDGTTIPKPRIVAAIPISGVPWGVAIEGRRVWVASYFDDLILGVDPDTNLEVDRISVPEKTPYELVATRGAVWAGAFSSILRIDPAARRAIDTGGLVGPGGKGYPAGMAAGAGSLWLSDHHRGLILRVDPTRNRTVAEIPIPHPTEVAFGEGSLWVGSCPDRGSAPVYRIDPRSNRVIATITLPASGCVGLPTVGGGFAYVLSSVEEEQAPNAQMWKIDLATGRVVGGPLRISVPGTMVVYRGVVWVLNREPTGSSKSFLTMVDATTMRVLTRISVGENAWRMAVGAGSLWVPAMKDGKPVLLRIKP